VPGNPSNPRSFFLFEDMYDLDALNQVRTKSKHEKNENEKNGKTEKKRLFWSNKCAIL
jgi:hypothetical protein